MEALSLPRTRLWFASAVVVGLLGCGKATPGNSPATKADAARIPNGASGGAGGGTTGTGGATTATGGATSAAGGVIGTGGNPSGTGGSTSGTGDSTLGTGGATTGLGGITASTGGIKGDAGPTATGGTATGGTTTNDAGTAKDGPPDVLPAKDAPLDMGPPPSDQRPADTLPPPSQGDAGINVPDGYKLVWSDEFNIDGTPDPKNWNYEKGFVRNSELQWYQPNNATVKGGVLIIEARKEQVANPNYVAGSTDWKLNRQVAEYTSTSMTTSGLQSWQYGRLEMRGRIPTGAGMWPAWWTLGVAGEWPSNGEIDIMEFYKGNVLANVACGTATRWTAKWDSSSKAISSLGANWSSDFHIWRMDWDSQNINLYLDDVLMNGVPLSTMLNTDGTSPFNQRDYMILNLAIGGVNGGDPAATAFPVQFEVDYVRVFQKL